MTFITSIKVNICCFFKPVEATTKSLELEQIDKLLRSIEALTPEQREAYLKNRVSQSNQTVMRFLVDALVGEEVFLQEPMPFSIVDLLKEEEDPGEIGPYKILRLLGSGGMGRVYEAWQEEPIPRNIALKVLHTNTDMRARARMGFEVEAMARLNHPCVAGVLDVGKTEEGPLWFTMVYFPGQPITDLCNAMQLSIRDRVSLFRDVCDGIAHIHRMGIIHRDLKPSNILAAQENGRIQVKIIDFGIARGVSAPLSKATLAAGPHSIIGTLDYMSPEQTRGQDFTLDTRSDIFSAAAVLYQMLCGFPPLPEHIRQSDSLEELLFCIREEDPLPPSKRILEDPDHDIKLIQRSALEISGELDWIVGRALQRDPDKRYASIEAFSEDLLRYLEGQPVIAGPPSRLYYLRKLIKRNRTLVSASLATLLILLGATLFSSWSFFQMRVARDQAVQDALQSKAQNTFMTDVLALPNPILGENKDIKLVTALERVANAAAPKFKQFPEVLIDTQFSIGRTFYGLGEIEKAGGFLEEAWGGARKFYKKEDYAYQVIGLELAHYYLNMDPSRSEQVLEDLNEITDPDLQFHKETFAAHLLRKQGQIDVAIQAYERLLVQRPQSDPLSLEALRGLATAYTSLGDYQRAEHYFGEVLGLQVALYGTEVHHEVLNTLNNLANTYTEEGCYPQALELHFRILNIRESALGERHPATAITLHNIGFSLLSMGEYEQSLTYFERSAQLFEELEGPKSPNLYWVYNNWGRALTGEGQYQRAIRKSKVWWQQAQQQLGNSQATIFLGYNLGKAYYEDGSLKEAVHTLEPLLAQRILINGPTDNGVAETESLLGRALLTLDTEKAIEHLRQAISRLEPKDKARQAAFEARLGAALCFAGKEAEGQTLLISAIRNPALAGSPGFKEEVDGLWHKWGSPMQ